VLQREHAALKAHCEGPEQLRQTYATVINELTLQNQALRAQANSETHTVTVFPGRGPTPPDLLTHNTVQADGLRPELVADSHQPPC
jgi:hypothetical protein